MRSEGDAPIADPLVDQVYDRLGTVHTFFKEVVGRDISDDANGLTVTIHYDRYYNNGFWDGQQLTIGDGDGKVFKETHFQLVGFNRGTESRCNPEDVETHICGAKRRPKFFVFRRVCGPHRTVDVQATCGEGELACGSWHLHREGYCQGTAVPQRAQLRHRGRAAGGAHVEVFGCCDVHENSGIPSKAFYEMATRLKGFAWERPAKIWYEAYWTLDASSKFQDLADATVRVATRLYGARSPERTAVVQSWAVVGIVTGK